MDLDYRKVCIFGVFVSVFIFILMLVYVWNFTIDDAFISFNYGMHLANGFGLVWNIGQSPVEGYTNFLWVLIIAVLTLLNLNPVASTKIIGLLSVVGIIILFWFISNDIFKNKKNKLIAFSVSTIFLLVNPLTAIHTVSGLETMFFAFLLLGVVYVAWKIILSPNSKLIWLFAFLALLLSLLRPEGILVSLGLIFSILYVFYKKNKTIMLTPLIPILILYFVPLMVFMIFRFFYFQELLPLPFLIKTVHGNIFSTLSDLLSALEYIVPFIVIMLIPLFMKYFRIESIGITLKTNYKYFLFTILLSVILVDFVYIFTELLTNYGERYFYPSFVMIYVASGIAMSIIFIEIENKLNGKKVLKNITTIIVCSLIVILLISNATFLTNLKMEDASGISIYNANIPLGKALTPYSNDNYTVACVDAGAVTYYSKWNQLDIFGLNDKFIAENGLATPEYVDKMNPELVILIDYNNLDSYNTSYNAPFYNFVIEKNYTRLDPIKSYSNYYLIPFLNPNIKDFVSIKKYYRYS